MIIIAGYELVDAEMRDSVVAAHCDLVSRASEFDGCLHVAITADSVDPERINSVEVWRDAEGDGAVASAGQRSERRTTQVRVCEAVQRHRRWSSLLTRQTYTGGP
jgi:hypothetical protein